jgi:hypothetical protein
LFERWHHVGISPVSFGKSRNLSRPNMLHHPFQILFLFVDSFFSFIKKVFFAATSLFSLGENFLSGSR